MGKLDVAALLFTGILAFIFGWIFLLKPSGAKKTTPPEQPKQPLVKWQPALDKTSDVVYHPPKGEEKGDSTLATQYPPEIEPKPEITLIRPGGTYEDVMGAGAKPPTPPKPVNDTVDVGTVYPTPKAEDVPEIAWQPAPEYSTGEVALTQDAPEGVSVGGSGEIGGELVYYYIDGKLVGVRKN